VRWRSAAQTPLFIEPVLNRKRPKVTLQIYASFWEAHAPSHVLRGALTTKACDAIQQRGNERPQHILKRSISSTFTLVGQIGEDQVQRPDWWVSRGTYGYDRMIGVVAFLTFDAEEAIFPA
jgi:hypothetical protein